MRKIVLSISIMLLTLMAYSQNQEFTKVNIANNPTWKEAVKLIKNGDKYFMKSPGSSKVSIPYYLEAYQYNSNSAELNYKLALSFLETYEEYKALPYAKKAYELNPKVSPDIEFVLAQAYHKSNDFETALPLYNSFREKASQMYGFDLSIIDKMGTECENGIKLKSKSNFKIRNVGAPINSEYSEYVPLLRADGEHMYYTARVDNSLIPKKVSKFDYAPFEALYKAKKMDDTSFTDVVKATILRDKRQRHESCVSLSADGKTMYFYNGSNREEIRSSEYKDGSWSVSKPVKGIDSKGYETHISTSADGQKAFVVSDRAGGFGGRDIYMYTLVGENQWGNPTNLGPLVNTKYDEDGVFIHPDGKTLYFSSRGHNTMGGFDVFYTVFNGQNWSVPVNLGPPVNTAGDDIFFVLLGNGEKGYLSSSRAGGLGEQDIYQFSVIESKDTKPDPKPETNEESIVSTAPKPNLTIFKGLVIDRKTREPIDAQVVMVDNSTGKEIFKNRSDKEEGFLVSLPAGSNYGISVNADGYIFHSENIDLRNQKGYSEFNKTIELSKIEVGASFVLNNVFFDFDKSDLKSESVAELNRVLAVLKNYPDIPIEIGGHTDAYGSDEYNYRLSQNRVESVKRFLINNGLAAARIVKVKGYGEEKPIDTNETPAGRAKNRRVEFKIVEK